MGKNRNRNFYFYFGRNEKHDYIATPTSNTLYAVNSTWGSDSFINNAIVRLIMECNPKELNIQLIQSSTKGFRVWSESLNSDRFIPQLKSISTYDSTNINASREFIEDSRALLRNIVDKIDILSDNAADSFIECENIPWLQFVYIIEGLDTFFNMCTEEEENELASIWKEILTLSEQVGVYFVATAKDFTLLSKHGLLELFSTSVTAKVDEKTSTLILGDNSANTMLNSYGDIYVKHNDEIHHLYVPFYPDTWIKKFTRYYGVLRS